LLELNPYIFVLYSHPWQKCIKKFPSTFKIEAGEIGLALVVAF